MLQEVGTLLNKNTRIKRPKIDKRMEVCGKEMSDGVPPPLPAAPPRWLCDYSLLSSSRWWVGDLTVSGGAQVAVRPVYGGHSAACLGEIGGLP